MSLGRRLDREDLSRQQAALDAARSVLQDALVDVSEAARQAAKVLDRSRVPATTELLHVYHQARVSVERAEAAVDHAELDLRTAAGEDA